MNIYTAVPRLSCFKKISAEYIKTSKGFVNENGEFVPPDKDGDSDNEDESLKLGGYFYGDATAYEHHLDKVLKQINEQEKILNNEFGDNKFKGGYQTNFSLDTTPFNPKELTDIVPSTPKLDLKSGVFVPKENLEQLSLNAPQFVPLD